MIQGRVEADLGDFESAARLFESVADDSEAPAELRWEALVRLGQVKAQLGRHDESVAAYQRVFENYADDSDAIRFLTLAVTGVAPGPARWESIWREVTLDVAQTAHATPVVRWPGFDSDPQPDYSGEAVSVSVHKENTSVRDIVRELSKAAGLSFAMYAEGEGEVTASFENTPWDRVLHLVTRAAQLDVELDGKVQIIGDAASFERLRTARRVEASGELISIDVADGGLGDILGLFADTIGLNIVVLPGTHGRVTMTLREVPWERALFYMLNSQGLAFSRSDHVLVVGEPERLSPYLEMETKDYRGDIISIDFAGSDFDEVMKFFSDTTGLQIVADDRFSGRITLKLTDVPWDQALDLIVKLQGLRFELQDTVIRIERR
jgi:type II secretory pathway component HofQ